MSQSIFIELNGKLIEPFEDPHNREEVLQSLAKRIPSLQESSQTDAQAPSKWRCVARDKALATILDPDTGTVDRLTTRQLSQTTEFQRADEEWDLDDTLSRNMEDQFIHAISIDYRTGGTL